MWLLFSNKNGGGFASIVAKDQTGKPTGPEETAILSVRFRRVEDAAKLFPLHDYVATPGGDYAGRIFATRMDVAKVLAQEALTCDYTNFKSSLPKDDAAIYNACMAGWGVFGKLQPGGPYGRTAHVDRRQSSFAGGESWEDYNTAYRTTHAVTTFPGTAKVKKTKRTDPFCDGCGMRHGAKALVDGFCPDCFTLYVQPDAEEEADLMCWSCGLQAADIPLPHRMDDTGLCPECVSDYADAGYTEADIIAERDGNEFLPHDEGSTP